MGSEEAFQKRVEAMSEEAKEHFKEVIELLSHCYAENSDLQAVLIMCHDTLPIIKLRTINCDEMSSVSTVKTALEFLTAVAMDGAPPKEQFN